MEALLQVMESTIAARDPYTVSHQQRVTQIACAIAQEMDLPEDRIQQLRIAARLHDLGKVAIPTELLARPGKLSPIEFDLIKTHPQVAYNILKPINFPGDTTEIILQHHERLDGSGYPQGLKEPEILLESKILGVADVMEAMCSHRPYRPALDPSIALAELSMNKGVLYDAAAVRCLFEALWGNPAGFRDLGPRLALAVHDHHPNTVPRRRLCPASYQSCPIEQTPRGLRQRVMEMGQNVLQRPAYLGARRHRLHRGVDHGSLPPLGSKRTLARR